MKGFNAKNAYLMSAPSIALPSESSDHVVDLPRLVRLFPSPWSFDTSPQETPPSRYSAVIYSADSTRICETRGENAVALAKLIINAVNHSLSNAKGLAQMPAPKDCDA